MAGIQPKHAGKLRVQLFALDNAKRSSDMNAPGWLLHPLKGSLEGHWGIRVSGNWRLTFAFKDEKRNSSRLPGLPLGANHAHVQSTASGFGCARVPGRGRGIICRGTSRCHAGDSLTLAEWPSAARAADSWHCVSPRHRLQLRNSGWTCRPSTTCGLLRVRAGRRSHHCLTLSWRALHSEDALRSQRDESNSFASRRDDSREISRLGLFARANYRFADTRDDTRKAN